MHVQVDLNDVLRDVSEYHGVTRLGYFIIYFALFNMVGMRAPYCMTSVSAVLVPVGGGPLGVLMEEEQGRPTGMEEVRYACVEVHKPRFQRLPLAGDTPSSAGRHHPLKVRKATATASPPAVRLSPT